MIKIGILASMGVIGAILVNGGFDQVRAGVSTGWLNIVIGTSTLVSSLVLHRRWRSDDKASGDDAS